MSTTPTLIAQYTSSYFLAQWIASWAAGTGSTANLQSGKATLATANSTVACVTELQYIAAAVAAYSRASTATGPDLDSWMAQFGFLREGATYAQGYVIFSAPAAVTQTIAIPVDTIVQVPGGLIQYQAIADETNANYNAAANAYLLTQGNSSVNVTVQAVLAGPAYNVQAGQLSQLLNTVYGISVVTNPIAITNGEPQQTDVQFRAAFVLWLNSLSKGTYQALLLALQEIPGLTQIALYANVQAVGNPPTEFIEPTFPQTYPPWGNIVAIVGNGSASVPAGLLTEAQNAIQGTIAWGMQYQVLPPGPLTVNINLNIRINAAATESTVIANVQKAVAQYVSDVLIGQDVFVAFVSQAALGADPNVISVESGLTINSSTGDLDLEPWQMALCDATTNVNVGTY